jgi:membrane associated rhomboid family serine protease
MLQLALLVGALGVAFAFLAVIAILASRENARASRPFGRNPMDWHPGRVFPRS